MTYDPFARGPMPVGVRTASLNDSSRNRPLDIEVWYPATDRYAGQDVAEGTRDTYDLIPGFPPGCQDALRDAEARPGSFPLVAFSHGYGGHRRQSTFLCTHLASHGYVAAAVDHTGNTTLDIMQQVLAIQSGGQPPDPATAVQEFITARPADVGFMIDRVLDGAAGQVAASILANTIGMTGHSFGGWTTIQVTARDRRIRAAVPLAPAGGSSPLPVAPLTEALDFNWGRSVPTLYLVAENDSLLPLSGMRELLAKTTSPKQMVVLMNADHMHFCDRIEQVHEMFRMMPPPGDFEKVAPQVRPIGELCPPDQAYDFVRALTLAHMDAHLKGNESAAQLLAGDVPRLLATRGVRAELAS